MGSSRTTTISLRLTPAMLEHIDTNAQAAGEDRNTYILGWLPENYAHETARNTHEPAHNGNGNGRKAHATV